MAESKNKRPTNLNCLVCGAPCRCSYFGAVCCESCKVFFRRAVMSRTEYRCSKKENSCDINVKTRRHCSACRMEKCLKVGMLKSWVINSPRLGKMKKKGKPFTEEEDEEEEEEEEGQSSSHSVTESGHTCGLSINEEELSIVDALLETTRRTMLDTPFPDEVFVDQPTFTHIINVFSIVVKRMVAFTKSFPEFRSLSITDQIIVLKSASLEILLTRKATTLLFQVTVQHGVVWMVKNGRFLFSKSNLANACGETLYTFYMRYIMHLMNLRVDDKALIILSCICLFSPDREGLSPEAKRIFERKQMVYVSLLERYLHAKYHCAKARNVFPKMLLSQWCGRETSHYYSQAVTECSNREIEPLMKEFFNLE